MTSFEQWLTDNGQVPTNWQREFARSVDALNGFPTVVGGARWGKTWLAERYAEYLEAQPHTKYVPTFWAYRP